MASDQLYLFTALAAFNGGIQNQLRQAQSPQDIIAIAADKGFFITVEQLGMISFRLNETYWVWSGRGEHWRRSFFASHQG